MCTVISEEHKIYYLFVKDPRRSEIYLDTIVS